MEMKLIKATSVPFIASKKKSSSRNSPKIPSPVWGENNFVSNGNWVRSLFRGGVKQAGDAEEELFEIYSCDN